MAKSQAGGYSTLSFEDQAKSLVALVSALTKGQATEQTLQEILSYAQAIPEKFMPKNFAQLCASKFGVTVEVIQATLGGETLLPISDFDTLVPASGWMRTYIDYTLQTEPPTVFHFFAGLTILGATIGRRVSFPRGSGDIYPNLCVVLVAPAGKCKKTTACNLAVDLYRRIGGTLLADKVTPESIVEALQKATTAQGLIYAPEWAVFLGRQQYLEGLVPLLTALFDCPDIWTSTTIMRGTSTLTNVAISHLAATTIDWMQTSITKDAFAGGFMSRLLFVVQKDTPRRFALPPPKDLVLQKKLIDGLLALQHTTGFVRMSPDAETWYVKWYEQRTSLVVEKHFAGYYERKPDRLIQLAMILNAAENPKSLVLSEDTLKLSEKILSWIERYLPAAFEELTQSVVGDEQLRLLKQLRRAGGELDHSEWLRKNTSRMNGDAFRKATDTLKQARLITFDSTKHRYYLLPAGKAVDV